jgi:two-component system OmpR family sensor kinase
MRLSIQGRLTLWYTGALLFALVACGLAVYVAVINLEMASVDAELRRAASTAAFRMNAAGKGRLDLQDAASDTEDGLSISGIAVALYDSGGQLLAARWEGLEPSQHGPTERFDVPETVHVGNSEWRRLLTHNRYKGWDYAVLSAAPLEPVRSHARRIRYILFAIIPITVITAAAGGWLSARSTLRPISRLAAEADQATHDRPAVRLSVPPGHDELTSLATAFNSLLQRLQTANESQRQFMADASHELRTPVSVIRNAADVTLSQAERSTDEYQDSIGIIAEQAKRLSKLVDDLFLLSRADVQARPLSTARFYLDDVVAECVRAAEVLGGRKRIRFELTAEEDVEIEADEDLVRRMLLNILENAVRYNPPGTRVVVRMQKREGHAQVTIGDDGIGIQPRDRERIFERFVRLDPKSSTGAGLGLPIARWIAEAHRGSLVLESPAAGAGSTFVVSLPLKDS